MSSTASRSARGRARRSCDRLRVRRPQLVDDPAHRRNLTRPLVLRIDQQRDVRTGLKDGRIELTDFQFVDRLLVGTANLHADPPVAVPAGVVAGPCCLAMWKEVFVGVLGASSYVFAQATWTQSLADWIAAHVNMLAAINGVPRQIVSDNLRAGITRACFYEPLVNRTYADMASHYGTAVIPARPYKPRDKAKVEVGVQVVQRWILARLRNRQFFSAIFIRAPAPAHRPAPAPRRCICTVC